MFNADLGTYAVIEINFLIFIENYIFRLSRCNAMGIVEVIWKSFGGCINILYSESFFDTAGKN